MNTSYLKTFIEVINLRNISKAAEKLFITQPAVSKQLQILEKEFGSILVKKNGREIIPTEEGSMLYKYAINVLNEEKKIYSLLKSDDDKLSGELLIYTSSLPADYYIHDLIIEFSKSYPDITYKIIKADSKVVYNYIEDGQTSFGFTGAIYKNKKIKNICIAEDEVILVVSQKVFDEFSNKKIKLNMLLEKDFIIREKGSATLQTFEDFIAEENINISDLNIKIQAEDNEIIKNFAKNSMGIAVMSKIAVEKEINEGILCELVVDGLEIKRELYYVYHKDRFFSKIEERFMEYIMNKFIPHEEK
jgi:DNA-binding transcriptional LysR family regulator